MYPKATIGRLPEYLHFLRDLGTITKFISATTVAKELDLGEVQVRKDFAMISGKGKPKTGYLVSDLTAAMESALGVHAECEAVIVGAGRLGKALLEFGGFSEYGITVRRAFDIKPDGVNEQVLPIADLPSYCNLHQAEIGIIAVPSCAAQEVADLLIKNGIRAIWCFAVCHLHVPAHVTVQYENMALSLAHLKNKVIHH